MNTSESDLAYIHGQVVALTAVVKILSVFCSKIGPDGRDVLIEALDGLSGAISEISPRGDGIPVIGLQGDTDKIEGFNSVLDDVRQTFVNNGAE